MEKQNDFCVSLRKRLLAMADVPYADFTAPLIPNIPRASIIGIRLPALRAMAKEFAKAAASDDAVRAGLEAFLSSLPHEYHEENMLHAFLIEHEKELPVLIGRLDAFLPHVTNWAVCDTPKPKLFEKRFDDSLGHFIRWMRSGHTYTVRFGIGMLMSHGLGERFRPEFHEHVGGIRSDEYYVNMMRAWYFATALAKNYDETLPWLDGRLDEWTHNMTIRKAIESRRVTPEHKELLKTLKRDRKPVRAKLNVAAGVVFSAGKVLICRRPESKARGGQWEFPGGKLEKGETPEQALVRELREELAFTVRPTGRLTTVEYAYPDVTVRLYAVTAESSETPTALEHSEICFAEPGKLFSYDLCPADRLIAQALTGGEEKRLN